MYIFASYSVVPGAYGLICNNLRYNMGKTRSYDEWRTIRFGEAHVYHDNVNPQHPWSIFDGPICGFASLQG